jgi:predicted O-linked N-acetylglucosamine transferase (SPINDLY family)
MTDIGTLLDRALNAYRTNDDAAAVALCTEALRKAADRPDAWTLLGMAHKRAGRIDDALAAYQSAIRLSPNYAEAHNNLGNVYRDQRRTAEAIACYRKAIECNPRFAAAWHNLGAMLDQHEGRALEALECFARALAIAPDNPDIHWDRGLALLALGRLKEGFAEYEWRWARRQPAPRELPQPAWRGEPLNGKRILVYAEQGFGDALQFLRFLPLVAQRGGRIVLEIQGALHNLLAAQPGLDAVISAGDPLPEFDCHVALMSIPHIVGIDRDTLPVEPYLVAPAERIADWARRIPPAPLLRVGLVWGGNPNVKNDAIRSPRLQPLLPLFSVPGVKFHFLQKGPRREDLKEVRLPPGFVDLDADIHDFSDTAAAIANLDLVISSDTSVAHLAAALGVPLWLLAQVTPDWRWARAGEGPLWYPRARIFRQPAVGRWDSVVAEVASALGALAATKRPPAGDLAALLANAAASYQAGRFDEARASCERVVGASNDFPDAWNLLGVLQRRAGDAAAAARSFREAITIKPDFADAWNNLGNALRQQGDLAGAADAYAQALRVQPKRASAWRDLSDALRLQDRFDEALAAAHRAVELEPASGDAHVAAGNVHMSAHRLAEAEASYRRAIDIDASRADFHYNLGLCLHEQGCADAAAAAYARGLERDERHPKILYNFALLHQQQGNHARAEALYLQLLDLHPDHRSGAFNLAGLHAAAGNTESARQWFRHCIARDPGHVQAWLSLANLYNAAHDHAEAIPLYRRVLELDPDNVNAMYSLAALSNAQGDVEESWKWYQRCVDLDPTHYLAEAMHLHSRFQRCDWSLNHRIQPLADGLGAETLHGTPCTPFPFLAFPANIDEAKLHRIAGRWARQLQGDIKPLDVQRRKGVEKRQKLRIGYVSSDFYNHATAHLMLGLFRRHDRSRIEVHAYSFGPDDGSHYRQRIAADCDAFTDLHGQSAQAIARRIAADGIDIAIDLKGYTRDSLAPIFAYRPAPLQVAYLGYPGSMGAGFIDVAIVDRVVAPPSQQAFYTERLAYMPHCYQVNDSEQPIAEPMPSRAECGLPEDGFVFCCFCTHYKIEPMIFGLWMEILRQVPGSVLWLMQSHPDTMANLRREARSRGIDPDRLVFAPVMLKDRHLSRVRRADLFLDTFYYNGHTTVSDALWAGVPVLTLPGRTFASRVGASLLQAVNLKEGIVGSAQEYVARAVHLAGHPAALRSLRDKLARERLSAPLFDTARFARDFDDLLWKIWNDHEEAA